MNRDAVIASLRAHETELRDLGITRLTLFGSVARGEHGNDLDLIADFDQSRRWTLLDMVDLERRLGAIVGAPVDLASGRMLKESVREHAAREAIIAF